jgi:uncharacterized protein (DUF2342 family)
MEDAFAAFMGHLCYTVTPPNFSIETVSGVKTVIARFEQFVAYAESCYLSRCAKREITPLVSLLRSAAHYAVRTKHPEIGTNVVIIVNDVRQEFSENDRQLEALVVCEYINSSLTPEQQRLLDTLSGY